jgi:predicted amidohydrolase YtcJ
MTGLLISNCRAGGALFSVYSEGGRIVSVSEDPSPAVPEGAAVLDGNGGTLLPGLADTHCHPFEYGWLRRSVDLRGTSNITGVRLRLHAGLQRAKRGEWVTGMGWDQETFPDKQLPTRGDIDDLSPNNPVALSRACGHMALLNSRAIEALGFDARSGAEYDRAPSGELTGIVKESALTDVFRAVPRGAERSAADLQSVEAEAARFGLTTLHCILSPEGFADELAALGSLDSAGSLSLRYRLYVPLEALEHIEQKGLRKRFAGDKVRINGVKIYADGSLGARTAALREPYSDDPSNSGLLRHTDEELAEHVRRAEALGLQAVVHAIGDRAVEQAVDAIGAVSGRKNPLRHRIEHASLCPRDLRQGMVRHGIRATIQPLFITSDTWATSRLGDERALDLYPLKSMLSDGLVVSGSSDSPIESLSPVLGMWASMVRGGVALAESLSLEDAIALYTRNAASNGLDDPAGAITEGAPADMTLLDTDVSGLHPALLRKIGAAATVVAGAPVHSYG